MSVQKEGQPAPTSVGTRSGATAVPAPQVTDSSPMSPVKVSVMCHGGSYQVDSRICGLWLIQ